MKRIFCISILISFSFLCFAQTQQGIVKTRGRMVNGQLVAGTKLSGATITLNYGNALVSGNNGSFSFIVPSNKNFSLVTAKKQGYTLADPEYVRRSFSYSASNPFYVVLEDENQRQADINAATRKVRKTLTAQLEKREEEIEELKALNKITEKEYQERLKQLYDNQSKTDSLVQVMAERYATTDYDQLDEFNRQVQMYIEEGELQKADSMIQSKGDIEKRVAEYQSVVSANKKVREKLEQSEISTAKTYEDISQDLYRMATIYSQEHKEDSVLYCLKMRADMDTTIVEAVLDYALCTILRYDCVECEKYLLIGLRTSARDNNMPYIAKFYSELGRLYNFGLYDIYDVNKSEKYYKLALENYEQLDRQQPATYRKDLCDTQLSLGELYKDGRLKDGSKSDMYYKLALDNYEELFKKYPSGKELADMQKWLGHKCLSQIKDHDSSEKYFKLALDNYERLFKLNPDTYRESLAKMQKEIGHDYWMYTEDKVKIEKYYKLALDNYEELFRQNPDSYREVLADMQEKYGYLYRYGDLSDCHKAEKYYQLALDNYKELFRQNPDTYREALAGMQIKYGDLYSYYDDFKDSNKKEKYYQLALDNYEELFRQKPDIYRKALADMQKTLGELYDSGDLKDHNKVEKYYKFALENYEELASQSPREYLSSLADMHKALARLYSTAELKNKEKFEKHWKLALKSCEELQNSQVNNIHYIWKLAFFQYSFGRDYLFYFHDIANFEKYSNLALDNYNVLVAINPEMYRKGLADIQRELAYLYDDRNLKDTKKYECYLKLATDNYEVLSEHNPKQFQSNLAEMQKDLGNLYLGVLHDYVDSEKYFKKSIENYGGIINTQKEGKDSKYLLSIRHSRTIPIFNLGLAYQNAGNMQKSEEYYLLSLSEHEELIRGDYQNYIDDYLWTINRVGLFYRSLEKYDKAIAVFESAFKATKDESKFPQNSAGIKKQIAGISNECAYTYAYIKKFDKAHKVIDRAIELMPNEAKFYDSKGEILLMQGKNAEALKMWKKALEQNPNLLREYPDGTNLSNGL